MEQIIDSAKGQSNLPLLRMRLTAPLVPSDAPSHFPKGVRRWGRWELVLNPPDDDPCDYWIVLGYAFREEAALVAPANTLFVNGEPPAKKLYPRKFYQQFHRVVDNHSWSRHPRLLLDTACLGWHVGSNLSPARGEYSYDFFSALPRPTKQNRIGVVCSATAATPGQRKRLMFLDQLKGHFGDRIVHFGRGFTPVDDKLDAILPYRFQLVLENSISPHYWTEKLADAYLGWGFPLYVGCPNLDAYFDPRSFQSLNLDDLSRAIEIIETRLNQNEDEVEITAMTKARGRMLNDYNLGMRCVRWADTFYVPAPKETVVIRDYKSFRWRDRIRRGLRLIGPGTLKPA